MGVTFPTRVGLTDLPSDYYRLSLFHHPDQPGSLMASFFALKNTSCALA
jgi:hypothetical protein